MKRQKKPATPDADARELARRLEQLETERDKYRQLADSAAGTKDLMVLAHAKLTLAREDFAQTTTARDDAKAALNEAETSRKAAKLKLEEAIDLELEMIARWVTGEQLLPFPTEPTPDTETSALFADPAASRPIGVLGQKSIVVLIGKDEVARLKSIGEPVGLTDKELDLLEGVGLDTLGKLDARMRKDDLWHRDITGFGETKINKLLNTLRVYRQHHPHPTESAPADPTSPNPHAAEAPPAPPEEPPTADWEQAGYHLREIVAAAQTLQENGPGDCIEEMTETVAAAISLELAIHVSKRLLPEQKEQIAALAAAVEKWKRPAPPEGGAS